MKFVIIVLLSCITFALVNAQGHSAQWLVGPNTSVLDFRIDTIGLYTISTFMNTDETNADICDTNGDLLYYTNGFYIAGGDGNSLQNGDTLSPCAYTNQQYSQGIAVPQAAIFLPKPNSSRYYYLFHFSLDTLNRPSTIYYSLIDKEGNSGLGSVIQKNVPALKLEGGIFRGGGMTACKHANGRDYWIVLGGSNNNEFYKFLVTPDSILGPFTQFIGSTFATPNDVAYSKFSQDGSKYVTSCYVGPVMVLDFDRCSGEFSNPINVFHYAGTSSGQPVSGAASVEFSPSGRFLYVNNITDLTQYDLWSDTIQDSTELYVSDSNDFYGLNLLQLAPNGKIYGSTWDGGLYALHVINYPDSSRLSCGFVYGGQRTLSNNSVNFYFLLWEYFIILKNSSSGV